MSHDNQLRIRCLLCTWGTSGWHDACVHSPESAPLRREQKSDFGERARVAGASGNASVATVGLHQACIREVIS